MDYLLTKILKTILDACSSIFYLLIELAIGESNILDITEYPEIITGIHTVVAVMFFMSVLKDISLKLTNVDSSFAEISVVEYITKIIFAAILTATIIDIMLYLSDIGLGVVKDFTNITQLALKTEGEMNLLKLKESAFVMLFTLIASVIMGLGAMFELIKTKVELLLLSVTSPFFAIESYKSFDKLNSLLAKFIGLLISMSVRIFLVSVGLYMLKKGLDDPAVIMDTMAGSNETSFLKNCILAFGFFAVAKNPSAIVEILTRPSSSGRGILNNPIMYPLGNTIVRRVLGR